MWPQKFLKSSNQHPPLHSKDLIIIPLLRLFEKSLSFLQAFFYLTVILTVFGSSLIVLNSWKIKIQDRIRIAYSQKNKLIGSEEQY